MSLMQWARRHKDRKLGDEMAAAIEASLTGKPSWAMDSRVFALAWSHAQSPFSAYLDALKDGDQAIVHALGPEIDGWLQQLAEVAPKIKVPSSEQCLQAVEDLRDSVRRGAIPSPSSVETIGSFAKETFC